MKITRATFVSLVGLTSLCLTVFSAPSVSIEDELRDIFQREAEVHGPTPLELARLIQKERNASDAQNRDALYNVLAEKKGPFYGQDTIGSICLLSYYGDQASIKILTPYLFSITFRLTFKVGVISSLSWSKSSSNI